MGPGSRQIFMGSNDLVVCFSQWLSNFHEEITEGSFLVLLFGSAMFPSRPTVSFLEEGVYLVPGPHHEC